MRTALIFLVLFVVGGVLMGFEMLGSRYLYPYFGGGITTWATLISTVLYALAAGYFAGGAIVDRFPSLMAITVSIGGAALYLLAVPACVDPVMQSILQSFGYGFWAILLAAAVLLAVPISLLGMLSPAAVRLLLPETATAGRTAGAVYGVSTIGNVFGTLFTTFVLIPAIGSRSITYCFAATLAVCGALLFAICQAEASPLARRRGAE